MIELRYFARNAYIVSGSGLTREIPTLQFREARTDGKFSEWADVPLVMEEAIQKEGSKTSEPKVDLVLSGKLLVEELCKQLNLAHDQILEMKKVENLNAFDWPTWSGQAAAIKSAERFVGKRLTKTRARSLFSTEGEPDYKENT